MKSNRTQNIKMVVHHFTGGRGTLPDELCQMCLEFSGCLRIGRRSLVFMTWQIPHYRGRRMKRITLGKH